MRISIFLLSLCFTLQSSFVLASEENLSDARSYFQKGKSQFMAELYKDAADSFRKAHRLSPNWKIYYNIAQSEAAAKRHGLALTAFETYLALGGDDISESRMKEIQKEIERLKKIVGFIEIKAPKGATITIDGVARGTAPLAGLIPVSGSIVHIVEVTTEDGVALQAQKVSLVSGKQTEIVFEEEKVPPAGPPEKAAPVPEESSTSKSSEKPLDDKRSKPSPLAAAGWTTLGVGAATLIAGGVTGGLTLSAANEVNEKCPSGGCYSSEYDLMNKRDNLALATNVLLAVGGTAAAAGIVMVVVHAVRNKKEKKKQQAFLVHPVLTEQTAGAALELRF